MATTTLERLQHLAYVALVACGHPPDHPTLRNLTPPAEIAGFADASYAYLSSDHIELYSLAGDRITQVGTVPVPSASELEGDWVDHDHLLVQTGPHSVVSITRAGREPVTLPADADLSVAKPNPDPDLVDGGPPALRVTAGAAYWARCAWGYPYDGFDCIRWISVPIWPRLGAPTIERPLPMTHAFEDSAPGGYTIDQAETVVHCTHDGATVDIARDGESIYAVHWLSAEPPRLLVLYGRMGYNDLAQDQWALHDGCTAAPVATGGSATIEGPRLWIAGSGGDPETWTLYRGATSLGELSSFDIKVRP